MNSAIQFSVVAALLLSLCPLFAQDAAAPAAATTPAAEAVTPAAVAAPAAEAVTPAAAAAPAAEAVTPAADAAAPAAPAAAPAVDAKPALITTLELRKTGTVSVVRDATGKVTGIRLIVNMYDIPLDENSKMLETMDGKRVRVVGTVGNYNQEGNARLFTVKSVEPLAAEGSGAAPTP